MRALAACLVPLLLLTAGSSCASIDRGMLSLRGKAGGIHNRRRAVGIRPLFLADGTLAFSADGALFVWQPEGPPLRLADGSAEMDDPAPSPRGDALLFVSGRDQVTAGGGHNDHVWQVYSMSLSTVEAATSLRRPGRRLTHSRRAEVLPRFAPGGEAIVFARRTEYEPYALYESPWGPAALFAARPDGSDERALTEPLFHPLRGLAFVDGGAGLVFGASRDDGASYDVFELPFPEGGEPHVLVEDALVPVPLADGRLVVVRPGATWTLELVERDGRPVRTILERAAEITDVAVAPGGERLVFVELRPEAGRYGTYGLWESTLAGDAPVLLHTLDARSPARTKLLDVVMPFGWWGKKSEMSPGSR